MKNTNFFTLMIFTMIFLFSAVSVSAFNATVGFTGDLVLSGSDVTFDYHRGEEFTGTITIDAHENLTNLKIEIPSAIRSEYNVRFQGTATNTYTVGTLNKNDSAVEITFTGTIPSRKDYGEHLISANALKISSDEGPTKEYSLYYDSPNQLRLYDSRILVNGRAGTSASPLDEVEVRVELRNDFTERVRIEEIDVDIIIVGFEDGGRYDFEAYTEIRSIREDRTGTATFTFDIPFDVYEDRYDIEIEARGIDENGAVHEITQTLLFDSLDVRRNRNDLYFKALTLSRTILSCENTRTTLDVDLYNIGSREQDDVSIIVENEELEIFQEKRNLQLESIEYDDRDARAFESFNLNIPEEAAPGTYNIDVFAYISGSLNQVGSVELTVRECPAQEEEEEEDNGSSIIVEERPREPIVITPQEPVIEETPTSDVMLFLLAGLNLVLIVAVIALLLVVLKKPTKKDKYF